MHYIAKVQKVRVDSFVIQMRSPSTHLRAFLKVSRMLFINELNSYEATVMPAKSDNNVLLATLQLA